MISPFFIADHLLFAGYHFIYNKQADSKTGNIFRLYTRRHGNTMMNIVR